MDSVASSDGIFWTPIRSPTRNPAIDESSLISDVIRITTSNSILTSSAEERHDRPSVVKLSITGSPNRNSSAVLEAQEGPPNSPLAGFMYSLVSVVT